MAREALQLPRHSATARDNRSVPRARKVRACHSLYGEPRSSARPGAARPPAPWPLRTRKEDDYNRWHNQMLGMPTLKPAFW